MSAEQNAREDFKFILNGRESHEAFHKINQLVPSLGDALRAAFNPEPENPSTDQLFNDGGHS